MMTNTTGTNRIGLLVSFHELHEGEVGIDENDIDGLPYGWRTQGGWLWADAEVNGPLHEAAADAGDRGLGLEKTPVRIIAEGCLRYDEVRSAIAARHLDRCSDQERRTPRDAHLWRGAAVLPDARGCCGGCGYANFKYSNGDEFSANGTRGYRCCNCGAIKPERWREVVEGATPCS